MKNGYLETIQKGLDGLKDIQGSRVSYGNGSKEEQLDLLRRELETADAIVIGAGAGMSTSAGFVYDGERFRRYFGDFADKYGLTDMYSGGFFPYNSPEEHWAFFSRNIYINRYMAAPKPVYGDFFKLMRDRNYFVITTNVDHQFRKAGFDKSRIFYTQGDYGLWQCSTPCHRRTYDNKDKVVKMLLAQGFVIGESGELLAPRTEGSNPITPRTEATGEPETGRMDFARISMKVPSELVPYCPVCGEPMKMNLRSDDTFVEDEGWHAASAAYADFLREHEGAHILFLELGVGSNTPVIIKYPFWQMTRENPAAVYACVNYREAFCPESIADRSICIDGDIGEILKDLR